MHQQPVECTGLVTVRVIVMKVAMEIEMITGKIMAEREIGVIGVMINMVEGETRMVRVKIIMVEMQMTTIAKMVIEMMFARQVGSMVTTIMHQEIGAQIERKTIILRMTINIHLGMPLLHISICYF